MWVGPGLRKDVGGVSEVKRTVTIPCCGVENCVCGKGNVEPP